MHQRVEENSTLRNPNHIMPLAVTFDSGSKLVDDFLRKQVGQVHAKQGFGRHL